MISEFNAPVKVPDRERKSVIVPYVIAPRKYTVNSPAVGTVGNHKSGNGHDNRSYNGHTLKFKLHGNIFFLEFIKPVQI